MTRKGLNDKDGVAEMGGAAKFTERALLDRLHSRHARIAGNGPEWAFMEHVRDGAGHYVGRTIDALAIHLWPSRKHEVHAYEVKCSRADFRSELKDGCAKATPWTSWVEFFWIVAPGGVVPLDELPERWGLLVPHGAGLTVAKRAVRLREKPLGWDQDAPPIPRSLVAAMLRSQVRHASKVNGFWKPAEREPVITASECADKCHYGTCGGQTSDPPCGGCCSCLGGCIAVGPEPNEAVS